MRLYQTRAFSTLPELHADMNASRSRRSLGLQRYALSNCSSAAACWPIASSWLPLSASASASQLAGGGATAALPVLLGGGFFGVLGWSPPVCATAGSHLSERRPSTTSGPWAADCDT